MLLFNPLMITPPGDIHIGKHILDKGNRGWPKCQEVFTGSQEGTGENPALLDYFFLINEGLLISCCLRGPP